MATFRVKSERGQSVYCDGCGRVVIWVTTMAGKRMPMDRVIVRGRDRWGVELDQEDTHWATCPKRSEFTKPKAAAKTSKLLADVDTFVAGVRERRRGG